MPQETVSVPEARLPLPFGGLSASALRVLAMLTMLLDHMWATVIPGNFWMTCVGRLAFPIFAFQIAEGFFHTSDRRRYMKRLLITALIAEIPFDLVQGGTILYPFHQNTIFTLILGLWAIQIIDAARAEPSARGWLRCSGKLLGIWLLALVGMVDYGWKGVATVVMFYLCRNFRGARLCQLAAMVVLHSLLMEGQVFPLFGGAYSLPVQSLAILALIPIWLYNGKRGFGGKPFQYAAYLFYPLHLLILYLIFSLR